MAYKNLFEHYQETLELLMDRYQIEVPDFIIFYIKTLEIEEELKALKINLSSIEIHKGLVQVEKVKKGFNSNILPYSSNEKYFGNLLLGNLRQKYLLDLVSLLEANKFSLVPPKKDEIPSPSSIGFGLKPQVSPKYKSKSKSDSYGVDFLQFVINSEEFLVFLHSTRRYLIISKMDKKYNYKRYVFNLKTGQFLFLSIDILKLDEAYNYLYKEKSENL